ncbi:ThiJ/PfpI family protein [Aspergillus candidus]|uniref:ThiJ/PfpI family protein n=1 Tax=Aspergillus candidus TaxID=41067 RepID=A0A2I2FF79_ASPCN|nr:ThiJ/PfpI family protein [Aspergillus candidus]PLB39249.1 ThiJ/PfpI family protein [Aspergillus candidus]
MPSPLNIGVLLLPGTQLLDLSCIDLLSMTDPTYLSACNLPQTLIHLGHSTQIHYIGLGGTGTLTPLTSNINMQLTASPTDSHVSPGTLNALLIPGTDPNVVPDAAYLDFIRWHHAHGTHILSVCTGSFVLGHAGILAGKVCTGPRLLVPLLRARFPEAKEWVQSVRVVRDGNIWTSGAITNGHDLIMQYLATIASAPLVNAISIMADLPARLVEYETSVAGDTTHFVWQIIRAVPSMLYWGFGK